MKNFILDFFVLLAGRYCMSIRYDIKYFLFTLFKAGAMRESLVLTIVLILFLDSSENMKTNNKKYFIKTHKQTHYIVETKGHQKRGRPQLQNKANGTQMSATAGHVGILPLYFLSKLAVIQKGFGYTAKKEKNCVHTIDKLYCHHIL